jgi:methionyl-tRNA formyltransferase
MALAPVPAQPRRLVFLGTPAIAVPPLRALVAAGFDVALVVTRADKRRGRRAEPSPSPVKAAAVELGLPVAHRVDDALGVGADLGVVVAYGALIKPHVAGRAADGEPPLLAPAAWRGAAPVERAILGRRQPRRVCA